MRWALDSGLIAAARHIHLHPRPTRWITEWPTASARGCAFLATAAGVVVFQLVELVR